MTNENKLPELCGTINTIKNMRECNFKEMASDQSVKFYRYAQNYAGGSRTLLNEMIGRSQFAASDLLYPFMQVFCHYIELMLKAIPLKHGNRIEFNHEIDNYFENTIPVFEQIIISEALCNNIINPICEKDLNSLRCLIADYGLSYKNHDFRYPNKYNDPIEMPVLINLRDLQDECTRITALLNTAYVAAN